MRLTNVDDGDIVECDQKGRRFFAVITGRMSTRVYTIRPLDRNVNYFTTTNRSIVGLYRKAKGSL